VKGVSAVNKAKQGQHGQHAAAFADERCENGSDQHSSHFPTMGKGDKKQTIYTSAKAADALASRAAGTGFGG
jgi:hypothetical protein